VNERPTNQPSGEPRVPKPDYSQLEYIPAFVPPEPPAAGPPPPAVPERRINWQETPLIELVDAAAQQRAEEATQQRRRAEMLGLVRLFALALGGVVALMLAVEAVQFWANDRPPERALREETARVAAEVLRRTAVPGQPVRLQSAEAEWLGRPGRGRADYAIVVTLELRVPLYAPADSNGVQAYLQMQRSLTDAHRRMMERGLFAARPELAHPPVLPSLIAQTHRAGDRMVMRVPLEAVRGGWSWRLTAEPQRMRVAGRIFQGEELARQPQPHLVFGAPGVREEMRRLLQEGRRYILAVNAAMAEPR